MKPKDILSPELKKDTQKLLVYASFERALALEKAGKPMEAAAAFLQYQKDFATESNAGTALYNSMVIYFKLGLVENALDSAKLVLKLYPKFDRKADVITTVAETYEAWGILTMHHNFLPYLPSNILKTRALLTRFIRQAF